ncbi:unnamed protein product [Durusdinium trenchii]|uniref:Uncharacterized protein n=1 Tax=Durusdinium trenchii TaxID=1381693 RepID=A0ABP0S0A4_9DINO
MSDEGKSATVKEEKNGPPPEDVAKVLAQVREKEYIVQDELYNAAEGNKHELQWGLLKWGKSHIDPEQIPEMMTRLAFLKNRASFQCFLDSPCVDLSDDHLMRLLCVLVSRKPESDGCPCLAAMLASPRVNFRRFTERYGEANMEAFSDLRKRWCRAQVKRWLLCGLMLPNVCRAFDGKDG